MRIIGRQREKGLIEKIHAPDSEILITFSAGAAEARSEGKLLEKTICRVDQALYQAKELGRDRIEAG